MDSDMEYCIESYAWNKPESVEGRIKGKKIPPGESRRGVYRTE